MTHSAAAHRRHVIGDRSEAKVVTMAAHARIRRRSFGWICTGCGQRFDVSYAALEGDPLPLGPTDEHWHQTVALSSGECPGGLELTAEKLAALGYEARALSMGCPAP